MALKAKAIRQTEVTARKEAEQHEREQSEAIAKLRDRQAVMARLILWLMRYVWPRLSAEERGEIRQIIPDEMESEIRATLRKLP